MRTTYIAQLEGFAVELDLEIKQLTEVVLNALTRIDELEALKTINSVILEKLYQNPQKDS
jgi:hypothetical protein